MFRRVRSLQRRLVHGKKKDLKLALAQIADRGEFLKTTDPGLSAAQTFLGGWFHFFGSDGLRHFPFPGTYLDQPSELMDILHRLGAAIAKAPR